MTSEGTRLVRETPGQLLYQRMVCDAKPPRWASDPGLGVPMSSKSLHQIQRPIWDKMYPDCRYTARDQRAGTQGSLDYSEVGAARVCDSSLQSGELAAVCKSLDWGRVDEAVGETGWRARSPLGTGSNNQQRIAELPSRSATNMSWANGAPSKLATMRSRVLMILICRARSH